MMEHDFKGALEEFDPNLGSIKISYTAPAGGDDYIDYVTIELSEKQCSTIQYALRFTEQALKEPKTSMVKAAIDASNLFGDTEEESQNILYGASITFKAMVNKLAEECSDE